MSCCSWNKCLPIFVTNLPTPSSVPSLHLIFLLQSMISSHLFIVLLFIFSIFPTLSLPCFHFSYSSPIIMHQQDFFQQSYIFFTIITSIQYYSPNLKIHFRLHIYISLYIYTPPFFQCSCYVNIFILITHSSAYNYHPQPSFPAFLLSARLSMLSVLLYSLLLRVFASCSVMHISTVSFILFATSLISVSKRASSLKTSSVSLSFSLL